MEENKELKLDELENVNGGAVVASGLQNKQILDLGAGAEAAVLKGRVAGVQAAGLQTAGMSGSGMSGASFGAGIEVCPEEMDGPCEA